MNKLLFLLLGFVLVFLSCRKERRSFLATPYRLEVPSHFPQMPIPKDNPMTVEGVALGRKLFYDKQLSLDNSIACANCHSPANAFADNAVTSLGVNGTTGTRNAMALVNLGWQQFFFWDGRAATLEDQILQPVPNPVEMHLQWKDAVDRLKKDGEYKQLFLQAFATMDFDSTHVAKAIAQFLRTMISGSSRYDVMYKQSNNLQLNSSEQAVLGTITPEEWAGYDLFKSLNGADCFHCHNGPLIQVQRYANNGLDSVFADPGRGAISGVASDIGRFKIPSLRNIEYSAPYMHDGRFTNLDDVIEHYSTGIINKSTTDPLMEYAFQHGVQLDSDQKQYLKAFLLTMTDHNFLTNPAFGPP